MVEESYDGYKLDKSMTREFIDDIIERFKNNKRIHKKYVINSRGRSNFRFIEFYGTLNAYFWKNRQWLKYLLRMRIH